MVTWIELRYVVKTFDENVTDVELESDTQEIRKLLDGDEESSMR